MKELKEYEGVRVEVLRNTLFNCQICTSLPQEKVEDAVNKINPSGTENGWSLMTNESHGEGEGPVDCANGNGCKHYKFVC